MVILTDTIVLGAGITGLSASYYLRKAGIDNIILERDTTYGGLCNSFTIDGFTFDTFAHISFDNDEETYDMLEGNTSYFKHNPEATNYSNGKWIKNPAQNNLVSLPVDERISIIKGYLNRKENQIVSYADWLNYNFGKYFTDRFPRKYTRKYWTVEPERLDFKWIEGRMYVPSFDELLRGAFEESEAVLHYSKEARYPEQGGFKAFLNPLIDGAQIEYSKIVQEIDAERKIIRLSDGEIYEYDRLVSTIPLKELCGLIKNVPNDILQEADKLDFTSGVMVSLGFNKEKVSPKLWFYIYDEDILPARVYAPDYKSINNVPKGCSAIQAEIYYSKYKPMPDDLDALKDNVIEQLLKLDLFKKEDIIVSDIRTKKYANIMFTPSIYEARDKIHKYLNEIEIDYAGRWGEWDYLWVGQSFRSGKKAAERIIKRMKR